MRATATVQTPTAAGDRVRRLTGTMGPRRARGAIWLSGVSIVVVSLGLGGVLAMSQRSDRSRTEASFRARAFSSAGFVSAYISNLASSEQRVASRYLAARKPDVASFAVAMDALEFHDAALLDSTGHVLAVIPNDPRLLGSELASHFATLSSAESGHVAVSDLVRTAVAGVPSVGVAVPFETPSGRRVLSGAFPITASPLNTYLGHAVVTHPHIVALVDSSGFVVAASVSTGTGVPTRSSPVLRAALAKSSSSTPGGPERTVTGAVGSVSFAAAEVSGTPWRLVIAMPTATLLASSEGWTFALPWIALALIVVLMCGVSVLVFRLLVERETLRSFSSQMARAADTDELTGLPNRRHLTARLQAMERERSPDQSVSVLVMDLDQFKAINDTEGHQAGDEALRTMARCMDATFRQSDVWGRWGGDEFLAVLPGATESDAVSVAIRLRKRLIGSTSHRDSSDRTPLGVSIGCSTSFGPVIETIRLADAAMYEAKRLGGGVLSSSNELVVIN